jgi:hypothetical protein
MGATGLLGCDGELPKHIVEFPAPWQTLDPGRPMDKSPRTEVVTLGDGAAIEPGDLVELHIIDWLAREGRHHDFGDWWLWIGFSSSKETAFFAIAPTVANGLIGLREGTSLKFLDASSNPMDEGFAGELRPNPFGDPKLYSWRKSITHSLTLSVPRDSGYSLVAIKRVCKGQLQHRTVRLYDDGPVRLGQGYQTWISREPREMWIDEAQINARCGDGNGAVFQYGPLPAPGKEARTVVTGYFDQWFKNAWDKLPKGVQLTSR